MKNFDYSKILDSKFSSSVLSLISEIYEHKGKQNLFLMQKTDSLESLVSIAKVQSTEASNRIEGIVTTEKRINEIMQEKTMPKTRDEEEIMGYRDVLKTIHENYEHIKLINNLYLTFFFKKYIIYYKNKIFLEVINGNLWKINE